MNREGKSGVYIRNELALKALDRILELKLAFLEPPQLQLVDRRIIDHPVDHIVEATMFQTQIKKFLPQLLILILKH